MVPKTHIILILCKPEEVNYEPPAELHTQRLSNFSRTGRLNYGSVMSYRVKVVVYFYCLPGCLK